MDNSRSFLTSLIMVPQAFQGNGGLMHESVCRTRRLVVVGLGQPGNLQASPEQIPAVIQSPLNFG